MGPSSIGTPRGIFLQARVEDPHRLAERRLAVGLPPLEEQIEKARSRATAEGERPPAAHQAYAKVRDEWAASVGWRGG